MDQPLKPFACNITDCGMSFTNEDHLHVHTKKHDMVLQLGIEQKSFVADQTPTPTRFIRNCEEVGLFQELQNVNPFDEGFKKAMETRPENILELTLTPISNDDVLHTPQNIFPTPAENTYYPNTNTEKKVSTSVISNEETSTKIGAKITKLLNETSAKKKTTYEKITVTDDISIIRIDEVSHPKDRLMNETVYTNNTITINSNSVIKKCDNTNGNSNEHELQCSIAVKRDTILDNSSKNKPPLIISQKSLDRVVDSLNSDMLNHLENHNKNRQLKQKKCLKNTSSKKGLAESNCKRKKTVKDCKDYEVLIKFPTGKCVRMKTVEEDDVKPTSKELEAKLKLKQVIEEKQERKNVNQNLVNLLPQATLIPVSVVNTNALLFPKVTQKVAIPRNASATNQEINVDVVKPVINIIEPVTICVKNKEKLPNTSKTQVSQQTPKNDDEHNEFKIRRQHVSQRYRHKLKIKQESLMEQVTKQTAQINRLNEENKILKSLLIEHMQKCPHADDLRNSSSIKFVVTNQ